MVKQQKNFTENKTCFYFLCKSKTKAVKGFCVFQNNKHSFRKEKFVLVMFFFKTFVLYFLWLFKTINREPYKQDNQNKQQ